MLIFKFGQRAASIFWKSGVEFAKVPHPKTPSSLYALSSTSVHFVNSQASYDRRRLQAAQNKLQARIAQDASDTHGQSALITGPVVHLLSSTEQIRAIGQEIKCIQWAHALLSLVYAFIDEARSLGHPVPCQLPVFRFVQSGMAIEVLENPSPTEEEQLNRQVFMLEEVLHQGTFLKFRSQGS